VELNTTGGGGGSMFASHTSGEDGWRWLMVDLEAGKPVKGCVDGRGAVFKNDMPSLFLYLGIYRRIFRQILKTRPENNRVCCSYIYRR
jgi:hypothetical protein